jgi:hypothetical protein
LSAVHRDRAISADGDGLDGLDRDIQATIQEGRELLQEVSGGEEADAVMDDETAHKKRSYDVEEIDSDL